jgi:hypothetical protein
MPRYLIHFLIVLTFVFSSCLAFGQETKAPVTEFRLDSLNGLEVVNIKASVAEYRGRRAVHLYRGEDQARETNATSPESIAIVTGTDFKDGTIEVDLAGLPAAGGPPNARGFIGIAFRVAGHGSKFECLYIRPTNGRADDQLRRNHALQYESYPDYPWFRLRNENPGVYESYADMEATAWTHIKIEVAGTKAKLYINGAEQPSLIVNDLKLGDGRGQIALWTTIETDGYFSNLTVK